MPQVPPTGLTPEEQQLFTFMRNHPGQKRAFVAVDPILTEVARERAFDMANRGYTSHTIPAGRPGKPGEGNNGTSGPNAEVRRLGYQLPVYYPNVGDDGKPENYIESLAAGRPTAAATWTDFMNSPPHVQHLLGKVQNFFDLQTSVGIGHYYRADDPNRYYHYWVIITAPPQFDVVPADLEVRPFDLLGEGKRLTDSSFIDNNEYELFGIAVANGVERVRYRLETAAGMGSWREAVIDYTPNTSTNPTEYVNGDRYWYGTIQKSELTPGLNILHVEGRDLSGLMLKAQFRRSFTFVQERQLAVEVAGQGTLSPNLQGLSLQEIGKTITLTAKPKTGWIFKGWTGSVSSTSPTLTFTMQEATSVIATFVPHPFLLRKGTYNGLLSNGRGTIRVTPGSTGAFSGSITYLQNGLQKTYAFKGAFNPQTGDAPTITIKRTGQTALSVTLHMDVDDTTGFTATVFDGAMLTNSSGVMNFNRPLFLTDYQGLGRYTVLLPSTSAGAPEAPGWATLTVAKTGAATLRGALPDGVTFSHSTFVDVNGDVPIYVSLYGAKGKLLGMYHVPLEHQDSTVEGNIHWTKPQQPPTMVLPNAIEADFNVTGSFYEKPVNVSVIGPEVASTEVDIVVEGGNLSTATTVEAVLTSLALKPLDALNTALPKFKVSINAATGQFTGSFKHPVSQKVRTFKGVFLQTQNFGAGSFTDISNLVGRVGAVEVNVGP